MDSERISTVLTKYSSALIHRRGRRGTQRESGLLSPLRTSATSAVEPKIDNFVNAVISEKSGLDLCGFCGAPGVKTVYKDKLFGKSENAVIIENLPVRHCEICGENYYDPEVSRLIDEILAHPGERAIRRQINVVSLAA